MGFRMLFLLGVISILVSCGWEVKVIYPDQPTTTEEKGVTEVRTGVWPPPLSERICDCPEEKIIDKRSPNEISIQTIYYIYQGRKMGVAAFNAEWVAEHCHVPTKVLYD